MSKEYLWVEKYRPKKIDDVILSADLYKTFSTIVENGDVPNMLFSGTPGTGKTTVAKAICNELDLGHIVINGSEDGNIDTLRGKIRQFASSISLQGGYKVVILDEADYLNPQSTQPALRGFIEEFSDNCRFIFTCNFKNRIIEPLHSRCSVYDFNISKSELQRLCSVFMARLYMILDNEGVGYDQMALADLIMKYSPDWRRVLNECQRYSISGHIDEGILSTVSDTNYQNLFSYLKDKDFKNMRKWVVENIDTDTSVIFRGIYDRMINNLEPHHIPQVILILADYQYKNAFVADHELNVVACMTEIMGTL